MKQLTMLTLLSTILFFSCQKSNDTKADPSKVNISISSPATATIFHKGDTVHMNANVSYASELHGYELKITDTATGAVLYNEDDHVHNDHFTIQSSWVDTLSKDASLKLELEVEIDHDGNKANKEILFSSIK